MKNRFLLWLVIGCIISTQQAFSEKTDQNSAKKDSVSCALATIKPDEREAIQSAIRAFRSIVQKSPTARKEFDFFKTHYVLGQFCPTLNCVVACDTAVRTSATTLFLAPISAGAKTSDSGSEIAMAYHPRTHTIFIPPSGFSKVVLGMLFAHELQHAIDHMVSGMSGSSDMDTRIAAERSAYATMLKIADELTSGGWTKIVAQSKEERSAYKAEKKIPAHYFLFDPVAGDSARIASVFSGMKPYDFRQLGLLITIDANLSMINELTAGNPSLRETGTKQFFEGYFKYLMTGSVPMRR